MAGGKGDGDSSNIVPVDKAGKDKVTGLFDVLSSIQQYSVMEKNEGAVDADFFTTQERLEFFWVGLKTSFISGIVSALMTPIAIGVIEKMIPIFGEEDLSIFDKGFAFALAFSFSFFYALFIFTFGKYAKGEYTKAMIKNFAWGITFGGFAKLFLVVAVFHFIHLFLLKDNLVETAVRLVGKVWPDPNIMAELYMFIIGFKENNVFILSSFAVCFSTFMLVVSPWLGLWVEGSKDRKLKRQARNSEE